MLQQQSSLLRTDYIYVAMYQMPFAAFGILAYQSVCVPGGEMLIIENPDGHIALFGLIHQHTVERIADVEYAPCGYKTDNTPPPAAQFRLCRYAQGQPFL